MNRPSTQSPLTRQTVSSPAGSVDCGREVRKSPHPRREALPFPASGAQLSFRRRTPREYRDQNGLFLCGCRCHCRRCRARGQPSGPRDLQTETFSPHMPVSRCHELLFPMHLPLPLPGLRQTTPTRTDHGLVVRDPTRRLFGSDRQQGRRTQRCRPRWAPGRPTVRERPRGSSGRQDRPRVPSRPGLSQ